MHSSDERVSVVIIGAGVVGCAIAERLTQMGIKPWILEAGPRIAEGVTSRNSGVIHSAIYYPPGSLKADACLEGQRKLYDWCSKREVPHSKTGKWIVAVTLEEQESLEKLYRNAKTSGARDLEMVGAVRLREECPDVIGKAAIWAPWSGVLDPFELTRSFFKSATDGGAEFLFSTEVRAASALSGGGFELDTSRGAIRAEYVVNAAGLNSDQIARMVGIDQYKIYPWVGHYFTLKCRKRYTSLIYPVKAPRAAGLGVHLTLDLAGGYRLGPDVELAVSVGDFSEPKDLLARRKRFFESVSRFLPDVREEDLTYHSCGIRPKLRTPTEAEEKDFVLSEDLPGWINLVGIESPGLTASIDLADRVRKIVRI